MSNGRRKRSTLDLGHDAFLDIVANLVGILIILVVVLGAQSSEVVKRVTEEKAQESLVDSQVEEASQAAPEASEDQMQRLAMNSMQAASAQADSRRLEKLIDRYETEFESISQKRGILLDLLAEAKAAWAENQESIDQQFRLAAQRKTQFDVAREKLDRLLGDRQRLENEPEPVVVVEHLPTPMAKTVFGEELHFRLKGNRLSYVPIERLVDEIKQDFERVISGSRQGELDGAVGPVRGYVARYVMDKSRALINRGGSAQMATRVQLVGMTLEPMREPYGQSIQKVLAGSSEMDVELAGRDPSSTTITVWVYPDSFASFRQLKERLYAKGFATAARPLPMDGKISGSPQGSKSSAQ